MKYIIATMMVLTSFSLSIASCSSNGTTLEPNIANQPTNPNNPSNPTSSTMKINVGSSVFTATLNDNATATAFKAMLPLTINMSDLNANEKYFYFSSTLPTNATPVGNISNGDLMLYGNNCLVLFY